MRTAIYGAGAMGTVLGAYLEKSGYRVDLINRNIEHVNALNKYGATISGCDNLNIPVTALTPDEMRGEYDLFFLMTRQQDNERTADFLSGYLSPDGTVCTLQNGFPEPLLINVLGKSRVVGCTAVWGATMISPGNVTLNTDPDAMSFTLGSITDESADKLKKIGGVLQTVCPVTIENNFAGARWSKLLLNSAFSGISVVFNVSVGEISKNNDLADMAIQIMKECVDVSKKEGIVLAKVRGFDISKFIFTAFPLKNLISRPILKLATKKDSNIKSGMLIDLEKGRKTDIDQINGIVCRYGRKNSTPTPYNDKIVEAVHLMENGSLTPGLHNLDIFKHPGF
ncbi:MAG: 2-dehydropantoate 2-reductase [Ruminococcaceae bacterium]|nr:2-dehydropantoate 2-reductase [Oscillospiraceae bacterium]